MSNTLAYQVYMYEHGISAAQQRAADIRAGEIAAEFRGLRLRLAGVFRLRRRVPLAPRATGALSRA